MADSFPSRPEGHIPRAPRAHPSPHGQALPWTRSMGRDGHEPSDAAADGGSCRARGGAHGDGGVVRVGLGLLPVESTGPRPLRFTWSFGGESLSI